jgi:hypothetical protein
MSNHYEDEPIQLQEILKRFAPWFGLGLAIISIYFSYDGLDQTIEGGNPAYTEVAKYIGWVMAIAVTLIQFIFNTDFSKLSPTLRVVGIMSYVYSLYTNYLGMEHLFGFSGIAGIAISVIMDVTPEALIAWALEEETQGDLLGNIGKWFTGRNGGRRKRPNQSKQYTFTPEQKHQDTQPRIPSFAPQGKHTQGQGSKRREFLEQRGKSEKDIPNKFFGE